MRARSLSIAIGLTIIAALLALVPVTQTHLGFGPSYAYAFTCPDQSTGTANADGTFTCTMNVGSGEQPVMQDIIFNADGTQKGVGNTNAVGGGQINTSDNPSGPVHCDSMWNFFNNPSICIGRSISAFIGTALITVTAWLLQVAGLIFNWLMYYTVVAFGDQTNGFLTKGVLDAINLTWSAFRDISNIVIIGLFTFIAISIILGLNQFGNKKLIARVLIVAILINFSLLFTKIIIDFSNFTSYVFYNSASALTQTTPASLNSPFTQDGVAGQFIRFMGVTSVSDTFSTLKQGADNADSGWIILLHGLFGATLLLLAAIAFLYGSVLLTIRAVVLIFLLITSSFAFATYLIPKLSESSYGWNAWWKALFQNAIFAPLLMALLWATLALATALRPAGGTLGGLLSDPANSGNLSALFSYIIVLGFLIASFKVSSSFASSISGFSFAALNIGRLAGAPLALGSRFLAAPLLRNTVGRGAARESLDLEDRIAAQRAHIATLGAGADRAAEQNKLLQMMKQKEAADKTAKRDFNPMNLESNRQLAKLLGLKGPLSGEKKVGGFEGPRKEAAKEAANKGASAAISSEQATKLAEERKAQDKQFQMQKEAIQAEISAANSMKEAAKSSSGQISQLKQGLTEAMKDAANESARGAEISERLRRGGKSTQEIQNDSEFKQQEARIKAAHQQVTGLQSQINTLSQPLRDAERAEKDAKKKLEDFDKSFTKQLAAKFMDNSVEAAQDIAEHEAHGDEYVAQVARKQTKEMIGNKRLKKRIQMEKEVAKEIDDTPAPTATTT